jgi:hypothetical protein
LFLVALLSPFERSTLLTCVFVAVEWEGPEALEEVSGPPEPMESQVFSEAPSEPEVVASGDDDPSSDDDYVARDDLPKGRGVTKVRAQFLYCQ